MIAPYSLLLTFSITATKPEVNTFFTKSNLLMMIILLLHENTKIGLGIAWIYIYNGHRNGGTDK